MEASNDNTAITNWMVPCVIVGIALVWCYFETQAFMDVRGRMVGFHPSVLFAIPVAFFLSFGLACSALNQRSATIGLCSVLPVLILVIPVFYSHELVMYGWSNEIRDKSDRNKVAIDETDFSNSIFDNVPYKDHERMVKIDGFKWRDSDKMIAARNGIFSGFMVDSVPHVYICPLKNGARGVAWVSDTANINTDPSVRYEDTGVANWYIWTMSL